MRPIFTDRTGGVSTGAFSSLNLALHVGDDPQKVGKNRSLLEQRIGKIAYMNQVHGNRVAVVEEVVDEAPTADALVTGIPGINLAVMVADCIPLLLVSDVAVGAVHVGRRGLVNGVAEATISVMRLMGARSIAAHIGPAICGRCYEVSADIYHDVVSAHPSAAALTHSGTLSLDLPKALTQVLESAKISVESQRVCTVEQAEYFSYRRDGETGRQVGIIGL